jgi:hypothetical protein
MKRVIGLSRWGQWELRLEEERLGRIWGGYKTVRGLQAWSLDVLMGTSEG